MTTPPRSHTRSGRITASALTLTALVSPLATTPDTHADDRPNVLFIAIDDLRPETGAYGNPLVPTPHLDGLAESGVLFNKAYCQVALCAPSRASLLTGLRPDTTGLFAYRQDPGIEAYQRAIHEAHTLPQHFREAGYNTLSVGKIFHDKAVDRDAWTEERASPAPQWPSPETIANRARRHKIAQEKNLQGIRRIRTLNGVANQITDLPDDQFKDGVVANVALDFLDDYSQRDEPFFLAVGFVKPHLPFVAPRHAADRVDRQAIPIPSRGEPKDASKFALVESWYDMRHYPNIPLQGDLPDGLTQGLLYAYYACVVHIDDQVGKLLEDLEQRGLADNTIVVVWGDHGWKLGDYGDWGKHTTMEIDARVPLIVRAPGMAAGQATDALVELIDLYPTLADLSGLEIPDHVEGTSFAPVLEDPQTPWKLGAITQQARPASQYGHNAMGYSLRTDRFRYTEWRDRATGEVLDIELYDHADGPIADENLANHTDYAEELETHRALLSQGWRGLQPNIIQEPN